VKGGVDMNIGEKIILRNPAEITNIETIENIVPVQYKDDGSDQWYEICDANKTSFILIIGKDNYGDDVLVTINKETCDTSLLLDLI
jgi:hypothetical protein